MKKTEERLDDAITWRAIYDPRNTLRELYGRAHEKTKMNEDLDGMGNTKKVNK